MVDLIVKTCRNLGAWSSPLLHETDCSSRLRTNSTACKMADKPARALLIYGDGLAGVLGSEHTNLHALASVGCCGFLALRTTASSEVEEERVLSEMAQLLDVQEVYSDTAKAEDLASCGEGTNADSDMPSLSQKFMGIKASLITNSKPAAALGVRAGFSVKAMHGSKDDGTKLPDPAALASASLQMLNLSEELTGAADFDLVLLHVHGIHEDDAAPQGEQHSYLSAAQGLAWVDNLVGKLTQLSQPGTKASNHLYLAVVLGYGTQSLSANDYPSLTSIGSFPEELSKFRPRQSYTVKGGHVVEDIRQQSPLLVVQHLNAVTRRDKAKSFSFQEFSKHGGNLAILADRFLHEVAFKLWKAPKYGA